MSVYVVVEDMDEGRDRIIVLRPSLERFVRCLIKIMVDAGLKNKIGKSMETARERINSIGEV